MMKPETKLIISKPDSIGAGVFKLSYYVYSCYGIVVHEYNYDTSRRQKRFHTN